MGSSERSPSLILQIKAEVPEGFPSRDMLAEKFLEAFRKVSERLPGRWEKKEIELGITLTDDSNIRAINKAYRGVDEATDVLSFPLIGDGPAIEDEGEGGPPLALGDIIISLETVARQAEERELSFNERFCEVLVHGMLHILGKEHSTEEGRDQMEALEEELVPVVMKVFEPLRLMMVCSSNR